MCLCHLSQETWHVLLTVIVSSEDTTRPPVQIGIEEQLVKHLSCKFTQRIFNHWLAHKHVQIHRIWPILLRVFDLWWVFWSGLSFDSDGYFAMGWFCHHYDDSKVFPYLLNSIMYEETCKSLFSDCRFLPWLWQECVNQQLSFCSDVTLSYILPMGLIEQHAV
jgi:hypothetical protein